MTPDQGHQAWTRRRYYAIAPYDVAELRIFHCDRACKITLSGLDSIFYLYKNEAGRINLRQGGRGTCNILDTYLSMILVGPSIIQLLASLTYRFYCASDARPPRARPRAYLTPPSVARPSLYITYSFRANSVDMI
jgi:hypothetical protein